MKKLLPFLALLFIGVSVSAFAYEDCKIVYHGNENNPNFTALLGTQYHQCRIANALEVIAEKMK